LSAYKTPQVELLLARASLGVCPVTHMMRGVPGRCLSQGLDTVDRLFRNTLGRIWRIFGKQWYPPALSGQSPQQLAVDVTVRHGVPGESETRLAERQTPSTSSTMSSATSPRWISRFSVSLPSGLPTKRPLSRGLASASGGERGEKRAQQSVERLPVAAMRGRRSAACAARDERAGRRPTGGVPGKPCPRQRLPRPCIETIPT